MAAGELQIYKENVAGDIDYQLIAADAAEVWVKTRPIDLQDSRVKKHLRRLVHDIKGASEATSLRVKLYSKDEIDGDEVLEESLLVAGGNALKFRFPNSRYIVVEFYDDDVNFLARPESKIIG